MLVNLRPAESCSLADRCPHCRTPCLCRISHLPRFRAATGGGRRRRCRRWRGCGSSSWSCRPPAGGECLALICRPANTGWCSKPGRLMRKASHASAVVISLQGGLPWALSGRHHPAMPAPGAEGRRQQAGPRVQGKRACCGVLSSNKLPAPTGCRPWRSRPRGVLGSTAKQMLCSFKALSFQGSQALCSPLPAGAGPSVHAAVGTGGCDVMCGLVGRADVPPMRIRRTPALPQCVQSPTGRGGTLYALAVPCS